MFAGLTSSARYALLLLALIAAFSLLLRATNHRTTHTTSSHLSFIRSKVTDPAARPARLPCIPDYVSALRAATLSPTSPPQLTFPELLWIASTVQTSAYMAAPRTHSFLVWGLGRDSALWEAANCVVDARGDNVGRTAFLENWRSWVDEVEKEHPGLEVHVFEGFKWTVGTADQFFTSPTLLTLPDAVQETCWDVVLVDGPQGYEAKQPGRMEATHWSVAMARRCIASGELLVVHIFLHDATRPVEQQIQARTLLGGGGVEMGYVDGAKGRLAGYRFTSASLVKVREL